VESDGDAGPAVALAGGDDVPFKLPSDHAMASQPRAPSLQLSLRQSLAWLPAAPVLPWRESDAVRMNDAHLYYSVAMIGTAGRTTGIPG